jgi:hypothetical protein
MGSLSKWLIVTSALIGSLTGALAQTAQSINTQLLAQAPVPAVQLATRHDDALKVDFIKADLDGSGKFQFIVAFYSLENDGQGIFLRVFQQQATGLLLVGEQEDKVAHGGYGISVHLVDINGDGIPEIEIEGHQANGAQILHQYFTWTGHSLHSSLDAIADSSLEDIDGDGIQELVASNGDGSFNLYKYNGTDFSLLKTVDHDPDGAIGPDGKVNIVRAHLSELRPHVFELNDILALTKDNGDGGRIRFIIGNICDLSIPGFDLQKKTINSTMMMIMDRIPARF